jgi:hypothetical protein
MRRKDIGLPQVPARSGRRLLPEQVIRRVDHGGTTVVADADHPAQPDPAAGLQAYLKETVGRERRPGSKVWDLRHGTE